MSTQVLTADEIVDTIQRSIDFHTREVEKLKAMLLAVSGKPATVAAFKGPQVTIKPKINPQLFSNTNIREDQLKEMVQLISDLDRPVLTSELMDRFNKGRKKPLKKGTIGAILSDGSKEGVIRNMMYNNLPNGKRNWWVLKNWVETDGTLNPNYLIKIKP